MKKSDFFYSLPEALIAQTPCERRDASRLMLLNKETGFVEHAHFHDLPNFLRPGDLLVMNDSRVLPARLIGHRTTGGVIETVLLRDMGENIWECLTKPGRKSKPGTQITYGDGSLSAEVVGETSGGNKLLKFSYEGIFLEVLERLGKMPLPPYIHEELEDGERYQTVYSKVPGSAAAPTAGLHFTEELISSLKNRGIGIAFVTLHVGLGTFRPVKVENIEAHEMHSEFCMVPPESPSRLSCAPKREIRSASPSSCVSPS